MSDLPHCTRCDCAMETSDRYEDDPWLCFSCALIVHERIDPMTAMHLAAIRKKQQALAQSSEAT